MPFSNPIRPPSTVELAPGSQVALADGSQVGIAGEVTTTAPVSQFWPCRSGETNPPSFTAGTSYSSRGPAQTVKADPAAAAPRSASWAALGRYSAYGSQYPLVVRFQVYIAALTGTVNWTIGHGRFGAGVAVAFGASDARIYADLVSVGFTQSSPLTIPGIGWLDVELVCTQTYTRLTLDNDTSAAGRVTLPGAVNETSMIAFTAEANILGGRALELTNLLATFPKDVPA